MITIIAQRHPITMSMSWTGADMATAENANPNKSVNITESGLDDILIDPVFMPEGLDRDKQDVYSSEALAIVRTTGIKALVIVFVDREGYPKQIACAPKGQNNNLAIPFGLVQGRRIYIRFANNLHEIQSS